MSIMRSSVTFLLMVFGPLYAVAFEPCTICQNGDPISNPDGIIGMTEPIPLPDCAALDAIAIYLETNSEECKGSQALGTICGCPIPENGCRLCGGDAKVTRPTLEVDSLVDFDLFYQAPPTRSFDCAYVEATLHNLPAESDYCTYAEQQFTEACCTEGDNVFSIPTEVVERCDLECGERALEKPDHDITGTAYVSNLTCAEVQGLEMNRTDCRAIKNECRCAATCSLCYDGSTVPNPDMTLDAEALGLPEAFKTCGDLETSIRTLDPMDDTCRATQIFARLCGCPQRENSCNVCGSAAASVPSPDLEYVWARGNVITIMPDYLQSKGADSVGKPMSCAAFESMNAQLYDNDDGYCWLSTFQSGACGCPNEDIKVLVWVQVSSGIVSAIASLVILLHALTDPMRRSQTYFQCMAAMSVFTFFGAMSHVLATFFMPQSGGYYMSIGNEATCQVQGFLSQISLTAIFYNMVLSVHFYLLLSGKTLFEESDNKNNKRKLMHSILIGVGLTLACVGIPFYDVALTKCQLAFPPVAYSMLPSIFLFIVPLSIVTLTVMMATVSMSYHYGARSTSSPERSQMFKQSLNYTITFMSIWLPQLAQFGASLSPNMKVLLILSSAMSPAQGTLNLITYLGPCNSCGCSEGNEEGAGAAGEETRKVADPSYVEQQSTETLNYLEHRSTESLNDEDAEVDPDMYMKEQPLSTGSSKSGYEPAAWA